MRPYIIFSLLFLTFSGSLRSQTCYFMKDTGTAEIETSNSAVEVSDGTVYVTGFQGNGPYGHDDISLLKFDKCGNVLWIKYFGDTLANDGYYIEKTSDEKILLVGQTGTPTNGSDAVFYILDTSGNILLQKLYGDSLDQMLRYVEQTSDKGFVACGYTSDPYGSNDSYIVKLDSLGNIQWQLVVGGPSTEYADMVHELPDGNFIITGDTKSFGHGATDVEIIKCNSAGHIIWDYYYGDNLDNGCQGIYLLSNGNYLSYGETNVPGSVAFDFFIEMIDTAGNSISRHTFGGTSADALFSLTELPGMDFMCTGYSRSFNGFSAYDIVLFRVDSSGHMKWLKNIYSPGIDIGYKIIPSMFGDYLLTGLFAVNNGNYFLMRTDTIANTNVGISDLSLPESFEVSPVPASDEIIVTSAAIESVNAELFSVTGELIEKFTIRRGKNTINTKQLPSGVYHLRFQQDLGALLVKKLLINH